MIGYHKTPGRMRYTAIRQYMSNDFITASIEQSSYMHIQSGWSVIKPFLRAVILKNDSCRTFGEIPETSDSVTGITAKTKQRRSLNICLICHCQKSDITFQQLLEHSV